MLLLAGVGCLYTQYISLVCGPLSGRGTVRKRLNRCNRCFRVKPVRYEELMGNLPENRVTMSRVFLNCGIDYAGPILIKEGRGRGKRSVKAYIAIFVCFVTRATHLELVSDCTAEAFVNACKRFMSRRGKPKNIYSDNAGNFKKGEKELNFLIGILKSDKYKSYVKEMSVNDGITWHNIPPRSPHFGGIWEAGVKAMKYHLKRTIGDSVLTFEEIYTVLTSVEACLNSRSLTPLSSSPQDLSALTPGHFLIGGFTNGSSGGRFKPNSDQSVITLATRPTCDFGDAGQKNTWPSYKKGQNGEPRAVSSCRSARW
jgi:hypothetical protein